MNKEPVCCFILKLFFKKIDFLFFSFKLIFFDVFMLF
jgi:hypothetical protein